MWAQGMAESVVAVVITKSVVAESVVVTVTRTRNSKGLDLKLALDTTIQTRIQESKY
jgi:hypothetical protein